MNDRNTFVKALEEQQKQKEEDQQEEKTFKVYVQETHYMTYKVKALTREQAERMVLDGSEDSYDDNYDNWEITETEELDG